MAVGAWLSLSEAWHGPGGQVVPFGGGQHPGYLPEWGNPVWQDTFDGPNIDTNKWRVFDQTYLSYDWGYILASQATIVDGMLRQRVSRRETPITRGGRILHWNTANMDTRDIFAQTYGRWEMRAKVPTSLATSQGVWPAFWLRNNPALGEIDIMESWGSPTRNRVRPVRYDDTSAWAIHESTNGDQRSANKTHEHRAFGYPPTATPGNTSQTFHTWAVEYTPNYLRFYFDGHMTSDIRPDGDHHPLADTPERTRDYSWCWGPTWTQPWHIRLNIQMGDYYWSADDDPATGALTASMPADYFIDYVRAWEYTP